MDFAKEQLSEVLGKYNEREEGLQELMGFMIESMMVQELLSSVLVVCEVASRLA